VTKTILLIGALDTKGPDFAFVKREIERRGHRALVVNTAIVGEAPFAPDISAERVAEAAGARLADLRAQADRGKAIDVMTRGIAVVAKALFDEGRVDGVLAMGGSAGTVIGTSAMRALPVGVPKVMVSTLASGDTRPYVGTKDIAMIHSVVDVAGVNRISARIYANAVGAVLGMAETDVPVGAQFIAPSVAPLIAASMFGNTTPAVNHARELLEARGYEVLVFHATGSGGQTMEDLIRDGYVNASLDLTTTEWADELVGGVLSAGPTRLDAAAERGIPQVIAPGCLDMVNFWARDTVPPKFEGRRFNQWNPNVTLMRTTPEENAALGRILAQKANAARGPVAFLLPLQGVSMLDAPGKEFWWPEADHALFAAIKQERRPDIPVIEIDANINDPIFAETCVEQLLQFLKEPT
jgi:uncharacterized protein (UPF0261 family)